MTTDIEENGPRRRVMMRRGRGFAAGSSSHSESLRTAAEPDEVDEAIDPAEMNRLIRERALQPRTPPPAAAPRDSHDDEDDRDNPRRRLNAVQLAGSASYSKEYRLTLLHRMLMRNVPLDQIAQQLRVSISTVEKDRVELKKMLREQAKSMHIDEMIGSQNAFYEEVSGMALRLASSGGEGARAVPVPMKLAAMRTSLAAQADKTRFLTSAGVFDTLRFRRSEDGTDLSDVQLLMQQTAELLANLDVEDEPAPVVSKPKRMKRTTPGGFKPMSFDDGDASSSGNEIQEL